MNINDRSHSKLPGPLPPIPKVGWGGETTVPDSPITKLHNELLKTVFSFVDDPKSKNAASLVSRQWNVEVAEDRNLKNFQTLKEFSSFLRENFQQLPPELLEVLSRVDAIHTSNEKPDTGMVNNLREDILFAMEKMPYTDLDRIKVMEDEHLKNSEKLEPRDSETKKKNSTNPFEKMALMALVYKSLDESLSKSEDSFFHRGYFDTLVSMGNNAKVLEAVQNPAFQKVGSLPIAQALQKMIEEGHGDTVFDALKAMPPGKFTAEVCDNI